MKRDRSLKPLVALRALRKLIADPTDTAQVFTIIEALSGRAPDRIIRRFTADPVGQRLLANRPNLLAVLSDHARLAALPDGSLGRAYLAFLEREQITAAGLVDASTDGELGVFRERGDDHVYVTERMRDTHDLWHVVTGYQGDVAGEAALLAFMAVQTTNPGTAVMALVAALRARRPAFVRRAVEAALAGLNARWLVAVDWEALLAEPLEQVRTRLGVTPAAPYQRFGPDWKPELATAA